MLKRFFMSRAFRTQYLISMIHVKVSGLRVTNLKLSHF